MKYLIAILLIIGGCTSEPEPESRFFRPAPTPGDSGKKQNLREEYVSKCEKLKYRQRIKIAGGFYKNQVGRVESLTRNYYVKIELDNKKMITVKCFDIFNASE